MLQASVLALSILAGQTWTVSNDGRADFSEIGDAIQDKRVAIGDILLVDPGEYEGFALDRDLTIVGATGSSRPTVTEPVAISAGEGALGTSVGFSFGFIDFQKGVTITGTPSAGRFDNCWFFGGETKPTALRVENAQEVTLSRCLLVGADATVPQRTGSVTVGDGISATDSRIVFVDSEARGGAGFLSAGFFGPNPGGHGATLTNSDILFAGGALLGGPPGGNPNPCNLGPAGSGLVLNQSTGDLRGFGANDDRIFPAPPAPCGPPGFSILATGAASKIRLGGPIGLRGVQAPQGALEVTTLIQPYLQNEGNGTPNSANTLRLRGEPNQFTLFFGSLDTTPTPVNEIDLPLGFDPNQIFFVGGLFTPSQQLAPANCPYAVPGNAPVLDGMAARFQCVLPNQPAQGHPTKATASNVVDVVIRF